MGSNVNPTGSYSMPSMPCPSVQKGEKDALSSGSFYPLTPPGSPMEVTDVNVPLEGPGEPQLFLDVNGDGLDDIVKVQTAADGYQQVVAYLNVAETCPGLAFCLPSGIARFSETPTVLISEVPNSAKCGSLQIRPDSITLYAATDVNGDGMKDILFKAGNQTFAGLSGTSKPGFGLFPMPDFDIMPPLIP